MVANAPIAADSVGVAQPAAIARPPRRRSTPAAHVLHERLQPRPAAVLGERLDAARALGFELDARDDVADEGDAQDQPGTMPPISSFEIEMPDRLPSSTVSAEGGISMSTPPIAMIGPIAMVGW